MADLSNRTIAVLATDGVKQAELTEPVKALKAASARVVVDGSLVTSRKPDDLADFRREAIRVFAGTGKNRRAA